MVRVKMIERIRLVEDSRFEKKDERCLLFKRLHSNRIEVFERKLIYLCFSLLYRHFDLKFNNSDILSMLISV